ncbi:hypothetical protein CCP3SC1_220021 [Gammaproteobacteria bacterium]
MVWIYHQKMGRSLNQNPTKNYGDNHGAIRLSRDTLVVPLKQLLGTPFFFLPSLSGRSYDHSKSKP